MSELVLFLSGVSVGLIGGMAIGAQAFYHGFKRETERQTGGSLPSFRALMLRQETDVCDD